MQVADDAPLAEVASATGAFQMATPSEYARHAQAELEIIIASLRLDELARLLELGRKLLEEGTVRRSAPDAH